MVDLLVAVLISVDSLFENWEVRTAEKKEYPWAVDETAATDRTLAAQTAARSGQCTAVEMVGKKAEMAVVTRDLTLVVQMGGTMAVKTAVHKIYYQVEQMVGHWVGEKVSELVVRTVV